MQFFEKTKGAISVFLILILVPMLTISAIFVDGSKIYLGRTVVSSAGDLALNTALTDYDTVLKDMYGLFATAQDTDEVYSLLEDYYRKTITSSGVTDEDADLFLEQIMNELKTYQSSDANDALNLELIDFSASKVEDANLANPTVIKSQIIEFMKYRSPINTGISFFSSLKSFKNLAKETELVDKRQNYYEEEQKVMDNLEKAYAYLKKYDEAPWVSTTKGRPAPIEYFNTLKTLPKSYTESYKKIHTDYLKDIHMYDKVSDKFKGVYYNFNIDSEFNVYMYDMVDSSKKYYYDKKYKGITDIKYSSSNKASNTDINKLITNYFDALKKYINDSTGDLAKLKNFYNENKDGAYETQLVCQMKYKKLDYNYTNNLVLPLYNSYAQLLNAIENSKSDTYTFTYKDNSGNSFANISLDGLALAIKQSFKQDFVEQYYEKDAHNTPFTAAVNFYKNKLGSIKTTRSNDNEKLKKISSELQAYKTEISDAKKYLGLAKKYLESAKKKIQPDGSLDTALGDWDKAASKKSLNSSSMAIQDRAEIENLNEELDPDAIAKLVDRVNAVYEKLDAIETSLNNVTYNGKSVVDITSIEVFGEVVDKKYNDLTSLPINSTNLNSNVESKWTDAKCNFNSIDISFGDNDPNFHKQNNLDFYNFLFEKFKDSNITINDKDKIEVESTKEGKKSYKKIKDDVSDTSVNEKTAPEVIETKNTISGKDLPSAKADGFIKAAKEEKNIDKTAKSTSGSLSTLLGDLVDAISNAAESLRDSYYVSDYIVSMFSYNTIENEKKYDSLDSTVKNSNYATVKDAIGNVKYEDIESKLVSLTQEPINKEYNYIYGSEVEYILYGKNGTTKTYASIYAIRLGFNLVYAFSDGNIKRTCSAIAAPISVATCGVIPEPLIQAALIIGLAVAESSCDIMCLKAGMEVPLMKNKNTWSLKADNLLDNLGAVATTVTAPVAEKVINNGLDTLNNWLDKTEEEINGSIDNEIGGLQKAVENTITTEIDRIADTVTQKVVSLIDVAEAKFPASAKNKEAKAEAIAYVKDQLNAWRDKEIQGKSENTAKIINTAVDTFVGGEYIDNLFSQLANIDMDGASTDQIQSVATSIKNSITSVTEEVSYQVRDVTKDMVEEAKNGLKSAAEGGADSLKSYVNDNICGQFGDSNTGGENVTASLTGFQYSDYLRLFLVIGLLGDGSETGILLRTADVIQTNMRHLPENADDSFMMKDAAVYVEIDATVLVRPTFLSLPIISDYLDDMEELKKEGNPVNDTSWYTIQYKGIKGY